LNRRETLIEKAFVRAMIPAPINRLAVLNTPNGWLAGAKA